MRIAEPLRLGIAGWKAAFAVVLVLCAWWPALATRAGGPHEAGAVFVEAPREWAGRPLRPLALGAVEQRFAAQFPGRIARLTDGEQLFVWRQVNRPTRMLHPAADCYRGLGYRIDQARLERDAQARLWRCFIAERNGQRLRVCERIEGSDGQSFTDASSWFWAAQLGHAGGPWQAITIARPL